MSCVSKRDVQVGALAGGILLGRIPIDGTVVVVLRPQFGRVAVDGLSVSAARVVFGWEVEGAMRTLALVVAT